MSLCGNFSENVQILGQLFGGEGRRGGFAFSFYIVL